MQQYIGIIPCRYGSTRLHAKALRKLCGKEMFWHVYTRARCCSLFSAVYIATDDKRIADVAQEYNIPYVMTDPNHTSGTDRVFEVAQKLNLDDNTIIANIQGDEPLIAPEMIVELLSPFANPSVQVSTLYTKMTPQETTDPARVKVIMDKEGRALYFSRSIIPHNRTGIAIEYMCHIGLYAFRYKALQQFVEYGPCTLECAESLEQLRFLYNGIPIHTVETEYKIHSVDEEKDIPIVETVLTKERLRYNY